METRVFLRKRIAGLWILFSAILFVLLARVGWLQFIEGSHFQERAQNISTWKVPVKARRGIIYDAKLRKLALSVSSDSVGAFPAEVKKSGQATKIAQELAKVLKMPPEEVLAKITSNQAFVYVKRQLADFQAGNQIKALKLPGIKVYEESKRYYPYGSLAAQVLGIVGIDNVGLGGVEAYYDRTLQGVDGSIMARFDALGHEIPGTRESFAPPQDGSSLVLTIDQNIQFFAERELDKLMQSTRRPKRASIAVMRPKTGEILALASRPSFDPNNYGAYPEENRRNVATSFNYEPGSTFKIVTAATAIEEGVVKPGERFYDPGYIRVGPDMIKCWIYPDGHGSETFEEAVQNSCNPVFVNLGLRLEEKQQGLFYKYIQAFGFGQPTKVDFPGEEHGIMIPADQIKDINTATISIGQGIAVTPLQLLNAACTVANGGVMMRPHLVKQILDPSGKVIRNLDPESLGQIVSTQTSKELCLDLERVVSNGTGRNAYIEGYRVAGKTGTAQKAGPHGYQEGKYVASFLGFAPANDPQVAIIVIVDEPQGYPYFGGTVAAPIFKAVMEDTLKYLQVPKQVPSSSQGQPATTSQAELAPDFAIPPVVGLSKQQAELAIKAAGMVPRMAGKGEVVVGQMPAGLNRKPLGTEVTLSLGQGNPSGWIMVPDVTGYRLREAAEILEAMGLRMVAKGDGVAQRVSPEPGSRVSAGASIEVQLAPSPG